MTYIDSDAFEGFLEWKAVKGERSECIYPWRLEATSHLRWLMVNEVSHRPVKPVFSFSEGVKRPLQGGGQGGVKRPLQASEYYKERSEFVYTSGSLVICAIFWFFGVVLMLGKVKVKGGLTGGRLTLFTFHLCQVWGHFKPSRVASLLLL